MKNMTKYDRLVWMVGETDDYDGTVAVGIACRAYDGVLQVLVEDELNGWWEEEYLPYLVFYRGERPTAEEARELVEEATLYANALSGVPAPEPPKQRNPDAPFHEVRLDDENFAAMAEAGMQHGNEYSRVLYTTELDGSVQLLFHNLETDIPDGYLY